MSLFEGEEDKAKFVFKGRFGAAPAPPSAIEEASHEEVDAFVKGILGLDKHKK